MGRLFFNLKKWRKKYQKMLELNVQLQPTWNASSWRALLNSASSRFMEAISVSGTNFPPNLPNFPELGAAFSSVSFGLSTKGLVVITEVLNSGHLLVKFSWVTTAWVTAVALAALSLYAECSVTENPWLVTTAPCTLHAIIFSLFARDSVWTWEREREGQWEKREVSVRSCGATGSPL